MGPENMGPAFCMIMLESCKKQVHVCHGQREVHVRVGSTGATPKIFYKTIPAEIIQNAKGT